MDLLTSAFFWVTLGQIMMINIVLSGDNAVVIALASRSLPAKQQKMAIMLGSFGAIALRVILTFFAVLLLGLPFLKIIGSLLLGWIGIQMLIPEEEEAHIDDHTQLWAAIKTIIIADFIMSLDNVLLVASIARENPALLVIGLTFSVLFMGFAANYVARLIQRHHWINYIGLAVILYVSINMIYEGWVGGDHVLGLRTALHLG